MAEAGVVAVSEVSPTLKKRFVEYVDSPSTTAPATATTTTGQQPAAASGYDMKLDVSNLEDVLSADKGWKMTINGDHILDRLKKKESIKVGIVGVYNRGKTTVTNLLAAREYDSGNLVHTQGMSCVVKDQIAFLDTAGQNQPLNMEDMDNDKVRETTTRKVLGDIFAQNMVVTLSDLLIIVVNQLTLEDQRYVRVMEWAVDRLNVGMMKKEIIVLHNLKDVEIDADLEKLIDTDIIKGFSCTERQWLDSSHSCRYWISQKQISHAVLARVNSEAGMKINQPTLLFLMNCMQEISRSVRRDRSRVSLLHGINDYVKKNLSTYFHELKQEECDLFSSSIVDGNKFSGLKLFIQTGTDAQLKQSAQSTEWQVIWDGMYELDYEVLQGRNNGLVLVKIDVPGIFTGVPSKAKMEQKFRNQFKAVYVWSEMRAGKPEKIMEVSIHNAMVDGKGPRVVVWASRKESSEMTFEVVSSSAKRGETELIVDVHKLMNKDHFAGSEVSIGDNGVLTVAFYRERYSTDSL